MAALLRKVTGSRKGSNGVDPTSPSGTEDKIMTEKLLALVKRKAGARTPSNSQGSQQEHINVDLPADYYTSEPHLVNTPGGASPRGGRHMGNHAEDESQGVRWGSDEDDMISSSDEADD